MSRDKERSLRLSLSPAIPIKRFYDFLFLLPVEFKLSSCPRPPSLSLSSPCCLKYYAMVALSRWQKRLFRFISLFSRRQTAVLSSVRRGDCNNAELLFYKLWQPFISSLN